MILSVIGNVLPLPSPDIWARSLDRADDLHICADVSEIGDRIRSVREASGLARREFALRVGMSESGLRNYERGAREISAVALLGFWDRCDELCAAPRFQNRLRRLSILVKLPML